MSKETTHRKTILMPGDPEFEKHRSLYEEMKNGVAISTPKQFTIGPENFNHKFYVLYQISKETPNGESWDFRLFFKDTDGRNVQEAIGKFNLRFTHRYLLPIKEKYPDLHIQHGKAVKPIRNQLDFLILGIPGRFIEMVTSRYFEELKGWR